MAMMDIYQRMPLGVQSLGVNAYALYLRIRRYNAGFRQTVARFKKNESLDGAGWERLQTERLRQILLHAARTVPHWRNLFGRLGLKENDLAHFAIKDLAGIPILTKEEIRSAPERFLSTSLEPWGTYYGTSGSTGTPLKIRFSQRMEIDLFALYEARVRNWAGVRLGMKRAMIGGRPIQPASVKTPPFHRYNAIDQQVYFSSCHISAENAIHYAKALEKHWPDYLVGISSAYALLGSFLLDQKIWVPAPRAVLCSADALTPEGRKTIERAFRCRTYDGWSSAEACSLISECECGSLHESPEAGIIELLDQNGDAVPPGEAGTIVCTGLLNLDQPLIRYRIEDLAVESARKDCACGRRMRIFDRIVGRLDEYVWTRDGIGNTRLARVWRGANGIREGQIIQESLDLIVLRIAAAPEFTPKDEEILRRNVAERLGDVRVHCEFVDHIERNSRGKFRAVISKVPPPDKRVKAFEAPDEDG
jgi:phenylacetate-CoA ligase